MRIIGAVLVILFIVLLWYNNLIALLLVVPWVLLIAAGVSGGDDRTVQAFAKMGVKFVDPVAMNGHDDEFLEWVKEPDNPNLTAGFINSTIRNPILAQSLMEHILGNGFKIYGEQICLDANYEFNPSDSHCMKQTEIDNITEGVIRCNAPDHAMSIVIKDRVINIYESNADIELDTKIMASFSKIFAKQIASGYVIKTLVDGVCPVKFQGLGGSGLCQSYALYIAALKILNPAVDFNVIEKYLSQHMGRTQIHILRFMYYIQKKIMPKLRDIVTSTNKYIPLYNNYVRGLYYPGLDNKDTVEYKNVRCVLNLYKIPFDISNFNKYQFRNIEYLNDNFIKLIEAQKTNKGTFCKFLEDIKAWSGTCEDPDLNLPLSVFYGQIYHTIDDLSTVRRLLHPMTLENDEGLRIGKIITNNIDNQKALTAEYNLIKTAHDDEMSKLYADEKQVLNNTLNAFIDKNQKIVADAGQLNKDNCNAIFNKMKKLLADSNPNIERDNINNALMNEYKLEENAYNDKIKKLSDDKTQMFNDMFNASNDKSKKLSEDATQLTNDKLNPISNKIDKLMANTDQLIIDQNTATNKRVSYEKLIIKMLFE